MARLPISDTKLERFCRKHHIERLSIFGSLIGESPEDANDVDILVEFVPGMEPGLIALAGMELELSSMLDGRTVDMRTPDDLSRYFREDVVARAEIQYAAE